jgi:predicted dehydrogenase
MTTARAAIIGFGGMGKRHLAACRMAGVDVVAIADPQATALEQAKAQAPSARLYDSAEQLLTEEVGRVDLVSIVTNGPSHAPLTIQAARAGARNILCEKPMATNLRDAHRMIEACRTRGTRLAINHIRRWSRNHLELKRRLDDGLIGPLRHIYYQSGSTGLGNMGTVFFDTMRFYADSEAAWVLGFIDRTGTPRVRGPQFVDPGGYGLLQFQNGIRGFVDTSEDTGVRYVLHLVGAYGRVVIDELNNTWVVEARPQAERQQPLTLYVTPMEVVPFPVLEPWDVVALTSRALANLVSGAPVASDGATGLRALELAMAFHQSDRLGHQRVMVPLTDGAVTLDVPFA